MYHLSPSSYYPSGSSSTWCLSGICSGHCLFLSLFPPPLKGIVDADTHLDSRPHYIFCIQFGSSLGAELICECRICVDCCWLRICCLMSRAYIDVVPVLVYLDSVACSARLYFWACVIWYFVFSFRTPSLSWSISFLEPPQAWVQLVVVLNRVGDEDLPHFEWI